VKDLTSPGRGRRKRPELKKVFMANGGEAISPPRLILRVAKAREKSRACERRARVIRYAHRPPVGRFVTDLRRSQADGILSQIRH
jgi:hypothetical protein